MASYPANSTFTKVTELAVAAPLVAAERLARMVTAGPFPSERDSDEFLRMYTEKAAAFTESWFAMSMAILRAQQEFAASFFRPFRIASLNDFHASALGVLDEGLAPLHLATTANVVRLARGG
jgi:hypothetical protein